VAGGVLMGSVFWGKFSVERFIIAFSQNGGTTFLSCAQEFPAGSFLDGASRWYFM